jgi:hypothetical protein
VTPPRRPAAELLSVHRRLDLGSVPATLLFGVGLPAARADTYARLLDRGIVPSPPVRASDTTGTYLERAFAALAKQYEDVPFHLAVAPYTRHAAEFSQDADDDENLTSRDPVCVGVTVHGAEYVLDGCDFDDQIAAHHGPLAAWLIEHVRMGTSGTFDAFTPMAALEYAEWGFFAGGYEEWWEIQRYDLASERKVPPDQVSWAEVRAYVRSSELRTPGAVRRQIGRHHATSLKHRLTLAQCEPLVAALPPPIRQRAQIVLEQATVLARVGERMRARSKRSEREFIGAFGAPAANPGLVIETSPFGVVRELLDDEYQYVSQDTGFGPNYALIIDGTTRSVERLRATLDDLHTATRAVGAIAAAIDADSEGSPMP